MVSGASLMFVTLPLICTWSPARRTSPTSTLTRGPLTTGVSAGTASPLAKRSRSLVRLFCTLGGKLGRCTCGSWKGCAVGADGSVGRGTKRPISTGLVSPPLPRLLNRIRTTASRIPPTHIGILLSRLYIDSGHPRTYVSARMIPFFRPVCWQSAGGSRQDAVGRTLPTASCRLLTAYGTFHRI